MATADLRKYNVRNEIVSKIKEYVLWQSLPAAGNGWHKNLRQINLNKYNHGTAADDLRRL